MKQVRNCIISTLCQLLEENSAQIKCHVQNAWNVMSVNAMLCCLETNCEKSVKCISFTQYLIDHLVPKIH